MKRLIQSVWTVLFGKKSAPQTDHVVIILSEHRYLIALEAAFFMAGMSDAFRVELHERSEGQKSEFIWLEGDLLSVKEYINHTTRSPLVMNITPEQDKRMIDLLLQASERLQRDFNIYANVLAYEVVQLVLDDWCDSIEYSPVKTIHA